MFTFIYYEAIVVTCQPPLTFTIRTFVFFFGIRDVRCSLLKLKKKQLKCICAYNFLIKLISVVLGWGKQENRTFHH